MPSKVSRNVFYVLFAIPVVFFLIRSARRIPRSVHCPVVCIVFVFFALTVIGEFFALEGTPGVLAKQSLYLTVLYIGLSLTTRSPNSLQRFLTTFGIATLVLLLVAAIRMDKYLFFTGNWRTYPCI